jgi:hypothetical protein
VHVKRQVASLRQPGANLVDIKENKPANSDEGNGPTSVLIPIQLLALNGRAHDRNGDVLHIRDWNTMPPEVLAEIRETTFISFPAVLKGTRKPEADGSYIFKSVGVNATVEHGMISIPNPQQAKAKAKNLEKRTLL